MEERGQLSCSKNRVSNPMHVAPVASFCGSSTVRASSTFCSSGFGLAGYKLHADRHCCPRDEKPEQAVNRTRPKSSDPKLTRYKGKSPRKASFKTYKTNAHATPKDQNQVFWLLHRSALLESERGTRRRRRKKKNSFFHRPAAAAGWTGAWGVQTDTQNERTMTEGTAELT